MPLFSDIGANPEEEITYRVNVDTSNLSAQLQQVRQEIGQSMQAGGTFSAPTMGAMMAAPIGAIENAQQQISTHANTAFGTAVMGLQRFSEDAQTAVDRVGGGWRDVSRAFLATGWSPDMPLTRRDWREAHARELDYDISMGFRTGGMIAGTAAGAWFGPWGAAIGGWAGERVGGMTHTAYATTIGRGHIALEDTERFIRDTSWRFAGGRIEGTEARDLAWQVQAMRRDPAVRGERLSRSDIQELQAEFTEIGGFDFVRSAEEYADRMRQVVTQHRNVMRTLRVSQSEALQIMRGLDDIGIEGQGMDYASTAAMTNMLARRAGYRGTEMLEFGMQSAQLAQGFGLNMGAGFFGGMELLTMLRGQPDMYSRQMIQQAGGIENIAMTMQQRGYQWASGPQGFLHTASDAGHWQPFGDRAFGAIQNINNIGDLLTLTALHPSRVAQETGGEHYLNFLADEVTRMHLLAPGVDVTNPAHFIGMQVRTGRMTHQEAARAWREMQLFHQPVENLIPEFATEAIWGADTTPWSRIRGQVWDEPFGRFADFNAAIFREAAETVFHRPIRRTRRTLEELLGTRAPDISLGGRDITAHIPEQIRQRILEDASYIGVQPTAPFEEGRELIVEPRWMGGRGVSRRRNRQTVWDADRLASVGAESIGELDDMLLRMDHDEYIEWSRDINSRQTRMLADQRFHQVREPDYMERAFQERMAIAHDVVESFPEFKAALVDQFAESKDDITTAELLRQLPEDQLNILIDALVIQSGSIQETIQDIQKLGGPEVLVMKSAERFRKEARRQMRVQGMEQLNIDTSLSGDLPEPGEEGYEIFKDLGLQVDTKMAVDINTMLRMMQTSGIAVRQAGGGGIESSGWR